MNKYEQLINEIRNEYSLPDFEPGSPFAKLQAEAQAEHDALVAALREAMQDERDEHNHALGLEEDLARLRAVEAAARELFVKPALGVYSDGVERGRLDNLRKALERAS